MANKPAIQARRRFTLAVPVGLASPASSAIRRFPSSPVDSQCEHPSEDCSRLAHGPDQAHLLAPFQAQSIFGQYGRCIAGDALLEVVDTRSFPMESKPRSLPVRILLATWRRVDQARRIAVN